MSFYRDREGRVRPVTPRGRARGTQAKAPASSGIVHEGTLLKHGYNLWEGDQVRREALRRAVKSDGYQKTTERVNALAVVNKGHEKVHRELESDLAWMRQTFRE